jgi:hypothetical protein
MTQRQDDVAGEATSLDDLFDDATLAQAARNRKQPKSVDPSMRNALNREAKKMREMYTKPENWTRTGGVAFIDKATNTLVGNFSEYQHVTFPHTRKWLREHTPISINRTEVVEGYLGEQVMQRLAAHQSWTEQRSGKADMLFDEMQVEAPGIEFSASIRLGVLQRVDLIQTTLFASVSGATLISLPTGTNVLEQLSTDSRAAVRKAVGL